MKRMSNMSKIRSPLTALAAACMITHAHAEVDFAHQIAPILKKHCVECHGGEESKGGFSLNTRALVLEADVLQPGNPDESLLIELLITDDLDERMPPADKDKKQLNKDEVELLKKWIATDVKWEPGFTFAEDRYEPPLKPRKVKLPDGPKDANPIDLIVGEYFKKNNISFPEPADDTTYLARVSQDITGLPPKTEWIKSLTQDGSANRNSAVEQLLADDQHYAEHWMTFWNDLLRNEYDGTGFITGGRSQITEWLYKSLLENKPYNQFVQELVAPSPNSKGFIEGIKWRGQVNASQTTQIQFSQNVSQVFLGINMKCASCHDSFIDRWTLRDAYSLAAIYSESPLELTRCDKPTGEKAKAAWIFPELGQIDATKPRDERLKQLAQLITHPDNGRMQRTIVNRLWMQLMGRGIVHPVDAMNTEPWSEDLLDYLANHLTESNYDIKEVLKLIATSRIYQAKSEVVKQYSHPYIFNGPIRKRMTAEQFLDSVRSVIGVWPKPSKEGLNGKKAKKGGQLTAVMSAHGLKKWDNRSIRAVFTRRDSLQAALGRPNREQVVTSRPSVITTLEAINLANGPEVAELMQAGAEKIAGSGTPKEIIERVFQNALSRPPSQSEMTASLAIMDETPNKEQIEDLLWSVFMLPEFLYIN